MLAIIDAVDKGMQILTVACELTKDGDNAVAHETISCRSVIEQGTVIPPSLVSTIQFQNFIVFLKLHLDPDTVRVTLSMILGKHGLSLI